MADKLLKTLDEVADVRHSALIIIDPQHDFCSEHGAMAEGFGVDMAEVREAVPRLNAFIESCREVGMLVVWVREIFSDSRMLPNHKAMWGAGEDIAVIPEGGPGIEWYEGMISPAAGEPVITKWNYDAFEDTDLHVLLQGRGIKTLLMTGFTTNVCVETTARHGYIKGYHIVLVSDCAGAPTAAEHESGIFNIRTYFGSVSTSDELTEMWGARAAGAAGAPVGAGRAV